jgi:hypothetical protein
VDGLLILTAKLEGLLALDPWTLADFTRHRDMNITKATCIRQEQTIRAVLDRARGISGGHTFGHTGQNLNPGKNASGSQPREAEEGSGPPGETRTPDLLVRSRWNLLILLNLKDVILGDRRLFAKTTD